MIPVNSFFHKICSSHVSCLVRFIIQADPITTSGMPPYLDLNQITYIQIVEFAQHMGGCEKNIRGYADPGISAFFLPGFFVLQL
ncbi:hypothetical protein BDZ91DRAFT_726985 [Kalaharituber pfeilii]|nr:hypothetical protein BDZ91DRAFT_726985 [Kalaharituber pfeilii]